MKNETPPQTLNDLLLSSRLDAPPPKHEPRPETEPTLGRATDDILEERLEKHEPTPPGDEPSNADEWQDIAAKSTNVWRIFQYPVLLPTLLCLSGLLGFYLYVQTVSLIQSLLAMPRYLQIPLFGVLILLAMLVLWGLYDYWRTYRRLRKNLQVVWSELENTRVSNQNRNTRVAVNAAVAHLKKYLKNYPIPDAKNKSEFFTKNEIDALRDIRARLTADKCPDSLDGWKNRFEGEFQTYLNTASRRRIDEIAKITAVKTAISPYSALDMLIVIYWSFAMIRNLCRVYNLKTGFVGTSYLLCCVFANTFFAGKLNDLESEIGKTASDTLAAHTTVFDFLPNTIQGLSKALTGIVAGKAATGMANYLLMSRLGYRAMQMLKPLR